MSSGHEHVSMDSYAYSSGIRDWNSGYKVFFAVGALVTVIAANRIWISIFTLCYMTALALFLGKVHLHDYIRLMLAPFTFILLSGLAIAVQIGAAAETPGSISILGLRLYITESSLCLAAETGLKALGAISALYLLTLSTPMGEILSVLRRLHVPELVLELMHLIYRYVFLLLEWNRRQRDAALARLGYQDFVTSLRTFGMELANLFVISMKKSGVYYDAMESRGYEGKCLFWEEKSLLPWDRQCGVCCMQRLQFYFLS